MVEKIGKKESKQNVKVYNIDISDGWDTESQVEILMKKLKTLKFYRPGLLYSGFDARNLGQVTNSKEGIVFCNTEEVFRNVQDEENPLQFAISNPQGAIAIYDPQKMEKTTDYGLYSYKIKDPSALLAIICL